MSPRYRWLPRRIGSASGVGGVALRRARSGELSKRRLTALTKVATGIDGRCRIDHRFLTFSAEGLAHETSDRV
jgi:hypothetical protein